MEIDLVYTWVDGNDGEFQRLRDQYLGPDARGVDLRQQRWRSQDELRYSLRSVAQYAPWIRTIHIVTNGQCPAWLNCEHPKINLVTHDQIYLWPEHLPTFNSTSIETHIHRIPGLSEQFIYANDDTFLGSPVRPEDFFGPLGMILVHPGKEMTEQVLRHLAKREAAYAGMLNALKLLQREYPEGMFRWPDHQMKPYTLLLYQLAELKWPEVFEATSANRFRCESDVALNYALLTNLAIGLRLGFHREKTDFCVQMGNADHYRQVIDDPPQFFCIHDQEGSPEGLEAFLSKVYPHPSEYEKA